MHTDSLVDLRRAPKPARERHEWCYRLIEMISKSAGCRGQRRVRIWPVTHRRSIWAPRLTFSGNPIRRRDSPRDLAFELRICTRLCPRDKLSNPAFTQPPSGALGRTQARIDPSSGYLSSPADRQAPLCHGSTINFWTALCI